MVSECANPRCREPFIYYRHGKLFSVPRRTAAVDAGNDRAFLAMPELRGEHGY